jgi:polysaccharide deacetylase family protein (PEP-CTERM system associated)
VSGAAPRALEPAEPVRPHLLTVAVEDYFQVIAFRKLIDPRQWYRFERRIERNTRKALDLLDEFGVKATFFTLGWVADEMPEIVREIAERGHEVASKGYYHRLIQEMTPSEFREDLLRSRDAIERATGVKVVGYRVARGHFGVRDLWALDVLAEEGFAYDSSFYPRLRGVAREPWRRYAFRHQHGPAEIMEFPLATFGWRGWSFPIAGGAYLRQLPHGLMRRALDHWHRRVPSPLVMYFHVWELDPELPKITAAPWHARLRQYRNLERMPSLLRYYLSQYRFEPIRQHLRLRPEPAPPRAVTREAGAASVGAVTARTPVTIVVPCFNEESVLPYLENTLRRVAADLGALYDLHYLFVDDGSTDGTLAALQARFGSLPNHRVLPHDRNRGVAAAILTGIRNAPTEVVCSIDCDCTYDPHQLRELIPMLQDGVAVVTASPYHPSGRVLNVPPWRLVLSKGLSALYRRVFRQKLHTYTSCFRVYRRSEVSHLQIREGGFLGVAEMLGVLDLQGKRIVEQPAILEVRLLGHSKMKLARTIRGHLRLLARLAALRWLPSRTAFQIANGSDDRTGTPGPVETSTSNGGTQ